VRCARLLALPGTAAADHVSATLAATAKLGQRVGNSWQVQVDWSITCIGTSSPLYFGNLSLEESTGDSIYLGGTSGASGKSTVSVAMKTTPRRLKPLLKSSCASSSDFHGSRNPEFLGSEVTVPALSCDPDLLTKALREYETAKSFYNAAVQDLRQAHEQLDTSLTEAIKNKAKKKAVKAALKEAACCSAKTQRGVERTLFWVKIGLILNTIAFKVAPKLRESQKAFDEAEKDMERGEAWRKRAEADLEAALKQGPCTGDLRKKLDQALDEQRRQRAARGLIESWENNGYLYLNPATGEALDEAEALREARRILEGAQRSMQSRRLGREPRIMATPSDQAAVARSPSRSASEMVRSRRNGMTPPSGPHALRPLIR
jgi:hypothetical protein